MMIEYGFVGGQRFCKFCSSSDPTRLSSGSFTVYLAVHDLKKYEVDNCENKNHFCDEVCLCVYVIHVFV